MDNKNYTSEEILEQLRNDYSSLKQQLEKQEIINERLMNNAFKSQVRNINSKAWAQVACGLFVIIVAPMALHYNPAMNLSWAFVAATDVMMAVCIAFTLLWHSKVKTPDASGCSMKEFAANVKQLKERYQGWLKYAAGMISAWLIWMGIEIFRNADDQRLAVIALTGVLVGGLIGGLIGLRMHFKVLRECDEILSSFDE